MKYEENDYIEQQKDIKLFLEEYIGEPILNRLISYPDLKKKPFGLLYSGHQLDYVTAKKIQRFQKYGANPNNARKFLILNRPREL